jgi:hypothetical protein
MGTLIGAPVNAHMALSSGFAAKNRSATVVEVLPGEVSAETRPIARQKRENDDCSTNVLRFLWCLNHNTLRH